MARAGIELNGVRYRWPSRPVVVVCIDGGDPAYFDRGVRYGVVPDLARGSVNFSSECAEQCTLEEHGIENVLEFVGMPLPDIYSPELSLFVLEAGIRLLEQRRLDLLYLSLTDYIQHKYAPGEPEADRYYRNMDAMFGRLDALGATVALTADHGMNDKSNP